MKQEQQHFQTRFLIFLFLNSTTILYGGGSFLEDVSFFEWIRFFSFIILIILLFLRLFINTNRAMIITLLLWLSLYIFGEIDDWRKSYIPSIGYSMQEPREYGVYEQREHVTPFIDKNITNLFCNNYNMRFLLVSTKTKLFLMFYDSVWDSYPNMRDNIFKLEDEITIKDLNSYQIVNVNDKVLLLDNNKTMYTYDFPMDREKKKFLFTQVANEALDKYIIRENKDSYTNRLIYGKQSKLFKEKYNCTDTGNYGIIIDKNNKSIFMCSEGVKYKTTYFKYTPKIATYIADSDTILIAFEEKKGLYVFRNKYTNIFNKIQESVTQLLKTINQRKLNKLDIAKMNLKQKEIQKLIDIFTPYEKNQHHYVDYKVIEYNEKSATVKIKIDRQYIVFFYLRLKKGNWDIEEIK